MMLEQLNKQMKKNEAIFREFYRKIGEAITAKHMTVIKRDALLGLQHFATLREDDIDAAVGQCLALLWFLELKEWVLLESCSLIHGVVPPATTLDDAESLMTLDGREVSLGSMEAHEIRSALRAWHCSDEHSGVFDPFTFIAFCEEERIDTNYLRLLRQLAGYSSGQVIGRLPLTRLEIFRDER